MKITGKYILENGKPVECDDLETWAQWMESHDRTIEKTMIGDILVSTIFLGLDHQLGPDGPPILYETMVFRGAIDEENHRYSTLGQAKNGHMEVVQKVRRQHRNENLHP